MPIALGSHHLVLLEQSNVEPNGRIERTILMEAQPRQIAVETLGISRLIKVSVLKPPIGNRAGNSLNQLLDRVLALLGILRVTVEVLADDDVGRKLAPRSGNLTVGLLEEHFAILVLDRRTTDLPLGRFKRIRDARRTEPRLDFKAAAIAANFLGRTSANATSGFDFCSCHFFR